MWQMEIFRNHQWHKVSHSGIRSEFPSQAEAEAAMAVAFPDQVRLQKEGGTVLVRVSEVK